MAKNVLRKQFGNMYGKNKPYEMPEAIQTKPAQSPLPPIEPPGVTVKAILFFTLIIIALLLIYLNREPILKGLKRIYTDFMPSDAIDKIEEKYNEMTKENGSQDMSSLEKKLLGFIDHSDKTHKEILERNNQINEKLERITLNTIEQNEKNKIETEKKDSQGAVKKIDERINQYRKEQIVSGNGFCYIGYDKNQRECTNVYDGDICMSGQVFPTIEVCLNPNLRP